MCFEFYCNPFYNIVNFKNKKLQIITASRKSYAYAPRWLATVLKNMSR